MKPFSSKAQAYHWRNLFFMSIRGPFCVLVQSKNKGVDVVEQVEISDKAKRQLKLRGLDCLAGDFEIGRQGAGGTRGRI